MSYADIEDYADLAYPQDVVDARRSASTILLLTDAMREVDRRADTWRITHHNTHGRLLHPAECPYCAVTE